MYLGHQRAPQRSTSLAAHTQQSVLLAFTCGVIDSIHIIVTLCQYPAGLFIKSHDETGGQPAMSDTNALVERYVAMWHEPDGESRRKTVAELWTPGARYVDPSWDATGYQALSRVVTSGYEEFIRSGKYFFRVSSAVQAHHDILRFAWELTETGTGQTADCGLDVLVTDGEKRIAGAYRFTGEPATGGEQNEFTDRYVRLWQTPDEEERRQLIAELWAPDGTQVYSMGTPRGHEEMFARVTRSFNLFIAQGDYQFVSAGDANGHHNLLRFNWAMTQAGSGEVADVGFEMFIRGDDGRILADYQFIGKLDGTRDDRG
jgi:hypothetical protein